MKDEFDALVERGILAHGFLRLRCGARHIAQTAAHQEDRVLPHLPVHQ